MAQFPKVYTLWGVDYFEKHHSQRTSTVLRSPSMYGEEIVRTNGSLTVSADDDMTPDFGDCFLVTIEKLPKTDDWKGYKEIIEQRKLKDAEAANLVTPSGRKFRV